MRVLPQLFYETPEYRKILVDGLSCIVHKKLDTAVWQKEGYVSAHAITLVLTGELRIENDEGLLAVVPENKMIFLPKGLYSISDILPKNGSFEAIVFFFDEEVITSFINSMNGKTTKVKCVSHFLLDYTNSIREYTESLLKLYNGNTTPHRKLTGAKLFEFLHLVSAEHSSECFLGALTNLNNKERKSLKAFMTANFSKPLSIEDYAYLTGRSLSTFRRDFKTHFGLSPKQWLIDKRLEKAHTLLSKNNTTISDVVLETGYENISHFIKAFHKRYGMPPKQFLISKRKEVFA